MGLPFRCLTASTQLKPKEAIKIYDDAVNQLKITYERTFDPKTGLNRHAYDETRDAFWSDNETGLSQHCWGRAQGWYSMALMAKSSNCCRRISMPSSNGRIRRLAPGIR